MARLRTFIAVALDAAQRSRCADLQETLDAAGAEAAWVERENLHVTLLFLGEVDERDVTDVCRAVARVCTAHEPFELELEGVGRFPTAGRLRTVWAGLAEGAEELTALHADLEAELMALGCYRHEDRPFTPHVTLGRVRSDEGDGLARAITRQAVWHGGATEVRQVLVLSSELLPEGPVYAVLSRVKLGGGERS